MKKSRIRIIHNIKTGHYIVQEKCLWFWVDVSGICTHISQAEIIRDRRQREYDNDNKNNWEVLDK